MAPPFNTPRKAEIKGGQKVAKYVLDKYGIEIHRQELADLFHTTPAI